MNRVVIYGSFYGTTKKYAVELAKRLEVDAIEYNEVKNINDYDSIIYLGGLYAGGVLGIYFFVMLIVCLSSQGIKFMKARIIVWFSDDLSI